MKRVLVLFALMISILFLAACDEDRSYTIDEVTIDAIITEDGTIHVEEQYTYTFSGSFNGLTRSIHSKEKNFQAFAVNKGEIGDSLRVEFDKDEDMYQIFQAATDETKSVIYTYEIEGSVEKYADTSKLAYQFFDSDNESDLHDLTISIQTESSTNPDHVYGYVQERSSGEVEVRDGVLRYTNELLHAGEDSMLIYLFPLEATPHLQVYKDKEILENELYMMTDWQERAAMLPENMEKMQPIMFIILIAVSAIAVIVYLFHPNRTRKYMDDESLQQLLESTDPVFIDYLSNFLTIRPNAVIHGLFSLKMRKVIRMEEVDSSLEDDRKTIRFTWLGANTTVDQADLHLKDWLFTETFKGKPSFLLETIVDDPDEKEEVRQQKGEVFDKQFAIWEGLVKERPAYEKVRRPFRVHTWMSILFILVSAGVFYLFLTFDQITIKEMFWLQVLLLTTSIIAIFTARYKFITPFYFGILIICGFVFFTLTDTAILAIGIFVIAAIAVLSIPAFVWTEEVGQLKKAIRFSYHHMMKQKYPLGGSVEFVENQLLYAIVLDAGKPFASQLGKSDLIAQLTNQSIFAFQPEHFVGMAGVADPTFYSAIALSNMNTSSTTSTTSSTGGGGAGAF